MSKDTTHIFGFHSFQKSHHFIGKLTPEQLLRCEQEDKAAVNQYYIPLDFVAKDFKRQSETERTKQEFDALVKVWVKETAHFSLERQQISNLTFLKIVAMGEKILPLIFSELGHRPMQGWLPALQAITRNDNVTSGATSFREAVECWLNWGKENGYINY